MHDDYSRRICLLLSNISAFTNGVWNPSDDSELSKSLLFDAFRATSDPFCTLDGKLWAENWTAHRDWWYRDRLMAPLSRKLQLCLGNGRLDTDGTILTIYIQFSHTCDK